MKRFTTIAGAAAAVALAVPQVATAGGLARPNPISARSIGMGGAFAAIADDPTALHFNPAGLANLHKSNLLLGIELAYAPRTYTPLDTEGNYGDPESPESPFFPLPVIGYASRLKSGGVPSRLAFGIGTWVSHGGSLKYPRFLDENGMIDDDKPALNETMNAVVELVPGIAYEVNDVLKLGVSLRLGFGLFGVNSTKRPLTSDLSSSGFGVGTTLGALVTPSDRLSFGAFYRSNLTIKTKGEGVADGENRNVEFEQRWPQAAGASVAFKPSPKLLVAAQLDWTGWQRSNALLIRFPGTTLFQEFDLDWEDNYSFHVGGQYTMSEKLALRMGGTYDTRAVSKRTQERQFSDSDKFLTAVGASIQMTPSWRLDTSFELILPLGATTIPNTNEDAAAVGWIERRNLGPGDHEGSLYTLELAAQYLF